MRWLRQGRNVLRFAFVVLRAAIASRGYEKWNSAEREQWLHFYSPKTLKAFAVQVQCHGRIPASGLVVSNHLSYLDILTLSSIFPCAFVSKNEVERWPLVGWLCRIAGTIFIDRRSRADTFRVNELVSSRLRNGSRVVVFPEGTSSNGSSVLHFHSSLLQPAIDAQVTVTPLHVSYQVDGGDAATEVCYWGMMVFIPHLLHMLGTTGIKAQVRFGEPQRFFERKTAAVESRKAIIVLADAVRPSVADHVPS